MERIRQLKESTPEKLNLPCAMSRPEKCSNCEHYFITWEKKEPYGCKAMGFKTAGDPIDLVERISLDRCRSFTLKKRLRALSAEEATGESSLFRKAAMSAREERGPGKSALMDYAVPWELDRKWDTPVPPGPPGEEPKRRA